MGDGGTVHRRHEDGIGVLTLENRARRNALSASMLEQIAATFDDWSTTRDVRAVVVRGAEGVFSAGADLSELGGSTPAAFDRFD